MMCSGAIGPLPARMTARSRTFLSSRTLPGHEYPLSFDDDRVAQNRTPRDARRRAVRQVLEEMLGDRDDVVLAVAERRDADRKDVEPVEEILAETPRADELVEVAVRRGDDSHVHLHALRRCREG